jgi:hypothetical protein
MKPLFIIKAGCFSLFLTTSLALSAQVINPLETPAIPGQPAPPSLPSEQPAPLPAPATPAEPVATIPAETASPATYPPCSATVMDRCANTRPEANKKASRSKAKSMRRHHKRS